MTPHAPGFLAELKRRHVWRVAIAYAVAAWLLLQLASIVLPTFGAPEWVLKVLIAVFVILFPVAVILAWAFEMTPEGVRRTEPAHSPDAREEHHTHVVGRKLNTMIIAVLVLAVALLGWRVLVLRHAPASSASVAVASIDGKSIAVLPFENLSNDKDNAYFADGMQDLILTKLADIDDLKVISRTSTEKYKSRPDNLKQVAAELGVATILEGSVQKAGKQVLVNVQLINADTDSHIWAESYTRTLDNIFGVEGEVAGKIADALHAKLSPAQSAQLAAAPTTNPGAYDAFLRAEYQANLFDANTQLSSLKAAIALYGQAVEKDPEFALAYARRSRVASHLAFYGGGGEDVKQLNQQAQSDAEHALQLQSGLPAAQLALGYCAYWGRRDYAAALKAFAAVLEERPNDVDALAAQGFVQRRQGRFDEAIVSLNKAVVLDPRYLKLTYELATTYALVGRYPQAETWFRRALALEPNSAAVKYIYSQIIVLGTGDIPRALAVAQGDDPLLKGVRVSLLSYQRKFAEAIALQQNIPDTPDNFDLASGGSSKAQLLATLYWQAGDKVRASQFFAQSLPGDKIALAQAQGLAMADLWTVVAFDQLGTGHAAEGMAAIAKSETILAKQQDSVTVPSSRLANASAYAMANRANLAVPLLAKVLTTPGIPEWYSPLMLWLDPSWDPIRNDPRFQALLQQYAKYKPAVTYDATPAAASTSSVALQ